ncbi:MAG: nicotinamide-nucleotide amidohydrolase family protein [Thermomicrobiales bacterium]|nr:nicotinamide-nucleotide amidohydrolase family protein [Thermomicrobiales bacterium]
MLSGDSRVSIATAESCTGGNIAARITSIAGSSAYFQGGVVAYDNRVKTALLGVPAEIIERYGAVSQQCAQAMAEGARTLFDVEIAVASTGIAGPGGGTRTKPVGLVYVGVATASATNIQQFTFTGDRRAVVDQATDAALSALVAELSSPRSQAK